uniref:Uncharacterized protein n=1 Tax=viral metagenome TaxID=1070528 RepID=A0A6C0B7J2_9ZZZZ
MNDSIKVILFLGLVSIILVTFIKQINKLFGGYDNCAICTPLHFNGYLSNWTLSHYLVFLIVGYLAPNRFTFIVIMGIAWEVMELYMEYISKTNHTHPLVKLLRLECDTKLHEDQFWKHYFGIRKYHPKKTLFWCSGGFIGSVLDIVADIAGAYTGIYLTKF